MPDRMTVCKRGHSMTDAYVNKKTGWRSCRTCVLNWRRTRYHSDPEFRRKNRAMTRKSMLAKYGITPEDYAALLSAQDGKCYICQRPPKTGVSLAVDHNHRTGVVRGLLCARCNRQLLGAFHEDIDIFLRAAAYLTNPPADDIFDQPRRSPDAPPPEYVT